VTAADVASPEQRLLTIGGGSVAVRATRAEDRDRIAALIDGLSPASRAMRFGGVRGPLRPDEAAAMAAPPGPDGLGLIALAGAGGDEAVAVARYDRRPGEADAELSLAVADAWQGQGVGTGLIERLVGCARRDGLDALWALMLPGNHRMREVVRDLGCEVQQQSAPGELLVRISTRDDDGLEDAAIARFARSAAASLEPLMRPRSVAVVGASRDPRSPGGAVLRALLRESSDVSVIPVNRSAGRVAGRPAVRSLGEVEEVVDLAVVAVPAAGVPAVAREAAARGVRGLVVLSAGFAEAGAEGAALEEEILHVVRTAGMRLVGPNCLGLWRGGPDGVAATFAPSAPPAGAIGLASQSGGLGLAAFAHCTRRGVGLSSFVSLGNAADVSAADLLAWWENDEATRVALLYLEGFGDARRFARLARRVSRSTPVVALKAGRGPAGRRGGGSHTAALAADEPLTDALFDLAGVVRVETLEDLLEAGEVLAGQPPPAGHRVGILSNVGGPGILAADACEVHGLTVPALSPRVAEGLRAAAPSLAGASNPVDLGAGAGPDDLSRAARVLAESGEIDALIVAVAPLLEGTGPAMREAVGALVAGPVPIVGCSCGEDVGPAAATPGRAVPWLPYPEGAARALAHAAVAGAVARRAPDPVRRPTGLDRAAARRLLRDAPGGAWLPPEAVEALLASYGIAMPRSRRARTAEEAAAAQAELGVPVAVKVSRPVIPHKTEVGGIRLGCGSPHAAAAAFGAIAADLARARPGATLEEALVQEMAGADGVAELIVGAVSDDLFGPVLLAGIGGTEAELWGDRAVALAPVGPRSALELWTRLHGAAQLDGWRGAPASDRGALADLVTRIAWLAADQPLLAEIDCNPVRAPHGGPPLVLDARVRRAAATG
jgi:acyl-CoA synthetase (NDP forming)/GNAT superfamily N-acetyltransferase